MLHKLARNSLAILFFLTTILPVQTASAASDREILRGFNLTVFGAEYTFGGPPSNFIRKFRNTVKFRIHNLSTKNRQAEVARFIRKISKEINGIDIEFATASQTANYNVYIVDRANYRNTAVNRIYHRNVSPPGKCMVRSVFPVRSLGIIKSDAVIVSDEGERLFKRCMTEEILQGLGVLNDNESLPDSIFNDTSQHVSFTRYDRYILNILYDKRIKNGATAKQVSTILPDIIKDVRKRLH